MTIRYKTQALIFQKNDLNESDRIFSVFTNEFGRLDIFAKAIRKINSKLRSGIDIFSLSEIEFIKGKNRKTLTDAVALERFGNFWHDPERLRIASEIREVLENFIRGEEKDEEIFKLIRETFVELNSCRLQVAGCKLLYRYFLWNLLALLGYQPETNYCASCKNKLNPYGVHFSFKEGGVVCGKCVTLDRGSQKINSDIVKILRIILKKDWPTVSRLKIGPGSQKIFEEVSNNYYLYNLASHAS